MKNAKLTVDNILEVQFKKKKFGGIDPTSVDEFLNEIIDDYEFFQAQIDDLKVKNEDLRKENFKVKMNVLKQTTQTVDIDEDMISPKSSNDNNITKESLKMLEQRVIELEKEVAVINAKITK